MTTLLRLFAVSVAALTLLTGCPSVPRSGQLEKPVFADIAFPSPTGGWMTVSGPSRDEVLPTRGRMLQIWFTAPIGSVFSVSLRTPDGVVTPLPENRGTQAPADEGFFLVANVNPSPNPPRYTLQVRAPLVLTDPANFDVLIVNRSLRSDVRDSDPLVISLKQRREFTVTVQIQGDGRVTSNPPGIACGTSASGQPLNQCSYTFGPYAVTLNPGSNNAARFLGWDGNCPPGAQPCTITLNGTAVQAVAKFGTRPSTGVSTCPTAPLLPGLRWIDLPSCAFGVLDQHPGITNPAVCDAAGYFCCEPGGPNSNSPRCGGSGKIESAPSCRHLAPRGLLRQPGGCYEIDSGP